MYIFSLVFFTHVFVMYICAGKLWIGKSCDSRCKEMVCSFFLGPFQECMVGLSGLLNVAKSLD